MVSRYFGWVGSAGTFVDAGAGALIGGVNGIDKRLFVGAAAGCEGGGGCVVIGVCICFCCTRFSNSEALLD